MNEENRLRDNEYEIPAKPDVFVGRDRELSRLSAWADNDDRNPMAITGVAGIGKTTLALTFGHHQMALGRRVLWWSGAARMADPAGELRELIRHLENTDVRSLLILDDVESVDVVLSVMHSGTHHQLLFTTRDAALGKLGAVLTLSVLSVSEAAHLLSLSIPDLQGPEARILTERLEGYPLLITLASRILNESKLGVTGLLNVLDGKPVRDVESKAARAGQRRTASAGRALYDEAMSMMAGQDKASAVDRLRAASASLEMSLGSSHPDTLAAKSELGRVLLDVGFLSEALALLTEVRDQSEIALGPRAQLTLRTRAHLVEAIRSSGEYSEAFYMLSHLLNDMKSEWGDHHPDVLSAQANLAFMARQLGQFEEASVIQREVVERAVSTFGSQHPFTLAAMGNLAALLEDTGNLLASLQYQRVVADASASVLGPEHPDTLASLHNMASTLYAMGALDEAASLGTRVYESFKKVSGLGDARTLRALNNLMVTLTSLNRADSALGLLKELLDSQNEWSMDGDPVALVNLGQSLTAWARTAVRTEQYELASAVLEGVLRLSVQWPEDEISSFYAALRELSVELTALSGADRSIERSVLNDRVRGTLQHAPLESTSKNKDHKTRL
jgi:tetratricopeptide (TPR) repeat protein